MVMNCVSLATVALIAYTCSSKLNTAEIIKGKGAEQDARLRKEMQIIQRAKLIPYTL
jgi:hypothetical protein